MLKVFQPPAPQASHTKREVRNVSLLVGICRLVEEIRAKLTAVPGSKSMCTSPEMDLVWEAKRGSKPSRF